MIDPVNNNFPGNSDMPAADLPGQLLKETRESQKMTREEVAERLHLDIDVIRALEDDNYTILPGDTYIKGYLRSYAGLLGIPFKNITFASGGFIKEAQLLPDNINYTNEPRSKKLSYFWISALLLFVLIIFSGLIQVEDTSQDNQGEQETALKNEADINTSSAGQEPESKSNADDMTENSAVVANEPDFKSADKTVTSVGKKLNRNPGLFLEYKKNSWTEVYDMNGKKLVYGMIKQGEKIEVDGLQPFLVLLGNAEAVNIKFEGKAFSHTKYIRNGMAQFVIGSSANN